MPAPVLYCIVPVLVLIVRSSGSLIKGLKIDVRIRHSQSSQTTGTVQSVSQYLYLACTPNKSAVLVLNLNSRTKTGRVLYPGLDHLQVSRTVFLPITPEDARIPGAIAHLVTKHLTAAPKRIRRPRLACPPRQAKKTPRQAILPNAPPQGDKVGGRRFFSRQDAAENGQD